MSYTDEGDYICNNSTIRLVVFGFHQRPSITCANTTVEDDCRFRCHYSYQWSNSTKRALRTEWIVDRIVSTDLSQERRIVGENVTEVFSELVPKGGNRISCAAVWHNHTVLSSAAEDIGSWCTTPPSPTSSSSLRTVGFVGLALAILALVYVAVKTQRTLRSTTALRMLFNTTLVALQRVRALAATAISSRESAIELLVFCYLSASSCD